MKCTNCGFENEANARSCQSCGAKLPKQIVEQTPESAEGAPENTEKKSCGSCKKFAILGIAAAAVILLLVIVISAIANSGHGFIEKECQYEIIQNEDGDLVVLKDGKLLKDKIDVESPDEVDWDLLGESIDGKVALLGVEDYAGEDDDEGTFTLYVIKKNKIVKVAETEDDEAVLSVNGDVVIYNEIDENEDEEEPTATLMYYTVKNGKTKEIAKSKEDSYVSDYVISPDGKTVVYRVSEFEEEGDGEMEYTVYLYNGKKSVEIMDDKANLVAVANKGKYIYATVEDEKEDDTEIVLNVYDKKGEKKAKLGSNIGYVAFNADCTQVIYSVRNEEKGDVTSYMSIKGKEGVKLAKTVLYLMANGIDANACYSGNSIIYPVEDLYNHVFIGIKYDDKYNATYDAYLVKKGEDKTVKLVSGMDANFTLDKSAEYLYYMEADDDDNTLKVLKISKGENAKDKAKTIADEVVDYVVTSNRKKVFFVDEDDSLCKVNGKKGGKSKTVASDVTTGLYINDKDVVYYGNEDEELYATTGGKGKKITEDIVDLEIIDGKLYIETEDGEVCYVNKTKKPKKIVTKYEEKAATPDVPDYDMPDVG
ncbi:MAG: zinc ribbon domain-containing protein [Ruminococcaceae bacterium]|nr:zinc ribbon domain-containing protein [Oscillospiraceae bacterium]